ncbi:MAG: ribose-5-phosphate isomerase A [Thermoleophilaceae bacterium]
MAGRPARAGGRGRAADRGGRARGGHRGGGSRRLVPAGRGHRRCGRGRPEARARQGGGGALLREKLLVSACDRFVVVAEAEKRVERLGEKMRLPVEVVRFAWGDTQRRLRETLEESTLREGEDGEPFATDEGHYLLDCVLDSSSGSPPSRSVCEGNDRRRRARPLPRPRPTPSSSAGADGGVEILTR